MAALLAALATLGLGVFANLAAGQPACTDTWTAAVSGSWSTAADWTTSSDTHAVPTASDVVCITTPGTYTVTLNGAESAGSITVGAGSTTSTQTLTIQGSASAGDAALTLSAGSSSTVEVGGEVSIDGTAGGSATLASPPPTTSGVVTPVLTNNGTLEFEGNDPAKLEVELDNATGGVVQVSTPDAEQDTETPTTNDGSFTIDDGDAFALSNEGSFTNEASVANAGSLTLSDSVWTQTVSASGAQQSGNPIALTDSTFNDLAGAGQFQLLGDTYFYGGIPAGQTVTVTPTTSGNSFAVISDDFTNDGTLILDADAGDSYTDLEAYVDPPTFTNNGTLVAEQASGATGLDYLEVDLDNTTTGKIEVLSGTLSQDSGTTTTNDGNITVDANASAAAAFDVTNESALTNDSDGTLAFDIASASSFGAIDSAQGTTFNLDGGTASPILVGGYAPPVGTEFDVITGTDPGTFTTVSNNFAADYSNATFIGLVRDPDSTTTTVSSSTGATTYRTAVTFTATIAPGPGGVGNPTGTVSFTDGSTALGTATPTTTAGVTTATLTTNLLAVGTHSVSASYGGSSDYSSSTSATPAAVTVSQAASTTALKSSANPATFGHPVTFTATVTGVAGAAAPTGTVSFSDGSTPLGTATLSTTAGVTTATLTTTALAVGAHSITATYAGNADYKPSTTTTALSQTVDKATPTVGVSPSSGSITFGQAVTFKATVTGVAGATAPSGTVTFTDGSTQLGTATLSTTAGVTTATLTTTTLAGGSNSITTTYQGDANYDSAASSTPAQVTVSPAASTTALKSSANPATFGQAVTFTATVTGITGAAAPSGTVTFTGAGTAPVTVPLSTTGGVTTAALTTSALAVGPHSITATYDGNGDYKTSTSSPALSQTVNKATPTTKVSSSSGSITFGQSVTFTATVTGPAGATAPTGTVTFIDGSTTLGTVALSTTAGVTTAKLPTSALAPGAHSITAAYQGNGDYNSAASASPTPVTVTEATPTVTVSPSSTSITVGEPVTFTATVTGPVGAPAPTGTVTFSDGSTPLATVGLSTTPGGASSAGGVTTATLTTSALAAGPHSITATYNGNADYKPSATAAPLQQTVGPPSVSPNQSTSSTTTTSATSTAATGASSATAAASSTTSSATTTTTSTTTPVPPPVLYVAENVAPVSGKVYIELPPGATLSRAAAARAPAAWESLSKGTHFIPLTQARQIPVGSILDTLGGTVAVTAASTQKGQDYTGDFTAGIFQLLQARGQKGLSDITLMDTLNRNKVCASVGKKASAARNVGSKVLGLLKSTDHGKFSTRGDYSAATVRGTQYSVEDTCAGTLTTVTRGSVVVDYFRRHKNLVVSAGQAFLAKSSGGPSAVVTLGKKPTKRR